MTIRQAVPLIWKYLMVVATSCILAFVISREGRASTALATPPANYAAPGQFETVSTDATWTDSSRKRDVPVRIIAPRMAADTAARLPVIVFSHGLGGSKAGGKLWGEHWASHGYVVIHMQHPGSDEGLWKARSADKVEASLKAGMTMTNLALRVGDVHFVIDEIVRLAKSGEGVFRQADAGRIGMSGHSFGAQTTLSVAGQVNPAVVGQSGFDKRVTAAIAFSPNARNKNKMEKQFGDIRMPFFSITGSLDGAVLNDGTTVDDRTKPFQHMPTGDKFLLVLEGADHSVFNGQKGMRGKRDAARDDEIRDDVRAATLAFWNAYLKADARALDWLRADRKQDSLVAMLASKDRFEAK